MKLRHNKKRNTAFLYEVLIKELVKSVVIKDETQRLQILSTIKEHFHKDGILFRELEVYKTLNETREIKKEIAEKIITEAKKTISALEPDRIFEAQSKLISKINKALSREVYNNFVPNYKSLATISQIFNPNIPIKSRVLLEVEYVDKMTSTLEEQEKLDPISNLTLKMFVKKFNETYGSSLLKEQQSLLNNFTLSFTDNGVGIKIFLNEEISRLRETMCNSLKLQEIYNSPTMVARVRQVVEMLDECSTKPIDKEMVHQILKIQALANEIEN